MPAGRDILRGATWAGVALAGAAALAAMERAGVRPADIEETVMGQARPAGVGPNPARQIAHRAGVPCLDLTNDFRHSQAPLYFPQDGHFNPAGHKHGMLAGPAHAGDMPNLHIPQSGELSVEVLNSAVTLAKGKPNSVFDNDGSAIVIHAKADDYKSDPAGNAGDRIACGVIQESGAAAGGSPAR